jgi:hypothetical protein
LSGVAQPANHDFAAAAAATPIASAQASPGASGAPAADPAVVAGQRGALPVGAVQVDCRPGVRTLPPNMIQSHALGWSVTHPGFYTLADGTCWQDPNAVSGTIVPAPLEGK